MDQMEIERRKRLAAQMVHPFAPGQQMQTIPSAAAQYGPGILKSLAGVPTDEEGAEMDALSGQFQTGLASGNTRQMSEAIGGQAGLIVPYFAGAGVTKKVGGVADPMLQAMEARRPGAGTMSNKLPPRTSREIAEQLRNVPGRNPEKFAKKLQGNGLISPDERGVAVEAINEIQEKIVNRNQARFGGDPLLIAAQHRPRLAAAARNEKRFAGAPIAVNWSSDQRQKVADLARYNPDGAMSEGARATLEAVVREAKKMGLTVRHTSKGKDGRVTSRYIVRPDGSEVRISDHYLPDTAQRASNREFSGGPRWVNDIVVDDWNKTTLQEYMNQILEDLPEG
jgi:hypothetical protein